MSLSSSSSSSSGRDVPVFVVERRRRPRTEFESTHARRPRRCFDSLCPRPALTPALNKPLSPCSYAFVEFRSQRDAEDAYYDMYVTPYLPYLAKSIILICASSSTTGMVGTSKAPA